MFMEFIFKNQLTWRILIFIISFDVSTDNKCPIKCEYFMRYRACQILLKMIFIGLLFAQ